jgi:hypothetical protein
MILPWCAHQSGGVILPGEHYAHLWTGDGGPRGFPLNDMPRVNLHVCKLCQCVYVESVTEKRAVEASDEEW